MNAGMYDEEGRPIGLAIVDGRQKHAINRNKGGGNFHLMPNGVFQRRDGGTEIVTNKAWRASPTIRFASQSGPNACDRRQASSRVRAGRLVAPRGANGVGIAPNRA